MELRRRRAGGVGGDTGRTSLVSLTAYHPSCSRPTVSSTGGSPSTTSVSGDLRARPSSRCRWGLSLQTWGSGVCLLPNMGGAAGGSGSGGVQLCSEQSVGPSPRPSRTQRPKWTGYGRRPRRLRRCWPWPDWNCGSRPSRVCGAQARGWGLERPGLGGVHSWELQRVAPPFCPCSGGGAPLADVPGH